MLALAMPWLGPASALAQQNTIVYRQVPYTNAHPSPIPLPWDASGYPIFSVLSGQLVLDLDGDGQPDVGFNDDDMAFHIYGVGSTRVLTYPPAGLDINSFLPVLAAGTEIAAIPTNASLIWRSTVYLPPTGQPYSATYNGCVDIGYPEPACFGLWQGTEGYTAVEFTISNEIHYAWIHVGVPLLGAQGGYVRSYAYETRPGVPLAAGQTNNAGHPPVHFTAAFKGANEVPANASPHAGSGTLTLLDNTLLYDLQLDLFFAPAFAGIYGPADPGSSCGRLIAHLGGFTVSNVPPPEVIPFSGQVSFPGAVLYRGQLPLSDRQVIDLLAGRLYVNFSSAAFPRGELRGQIVPAVTVQFTAILSGANEIPRRRTTRRASAAFALAGDNLNYSLAVDADLAAALIGIYEPPCRGRPSASPELIATLNTQFWVLIPAGGFPGQPGVPGQLLTEGAFVLTDAQAEEMRRGDLFMNILNSQFPRGEVRGPILPVDANHAGVPDFVAAYLDEACPCAGGWRGHAQYVRRYGELAGALVASELINSSQFLRLMRAARASDCGK